MARAERGRHITIILALVGVGGLLLLIAAQRFERPGLIGPGLLLFATGIVSAGISAMRSRYIAERDTEAGESVRFVGTPAVLFGITIVLAGLAFGAAGVAFTLGAERQLGQWLLRRPGLPLLGTGIALGAAGLAALIGAREWTDSTRSFLLRIPERLGGLFLLLFGLALAAAGVWEIAAPGAFDSTLDGLLAPLRRHTG